MLLIRKLFALCATLTLLVVVLWFFFYTYVRNYDVPLSKSFVYWCLGEGGDFSYVRLLGDGGLHNKCELPSGDVKVK